MPVRHDDDALACGDRRSLAGFRGPTARLASASPTDTHVRFKGTRMAAVIDCDTHLFEPADLWASHLPSGQKDLALRIDHDDLGYPWLMHRDRRLGLAEPHTPGQVSRVGEFRERFRAGVRNVDEDDRELRAEYGDVAARLRHLDDEGFDAAVMFPNYGLGWERALSPEPESMLANMAAWNRWAVEVHAESGGRLHPVAHLSLQDLDWLDDQLAFVAEGGLRLGFIAPGVVNGLPPSAPELRRAWASFDHHHVSPVFHVASQERPFVDGWYARESDNDLSTLQSVFLWTAPALAITDLVLGGVLEQYPNLRIGVMELSAVWVPMFLQYLDGGVRFTTEFNGRSSPGLAMTPSDYVRRQVRVAAFSYERPDALIARAGDVFMACSDYPHTEGTATALADYKAIGMEPGDNSAFFGGNVAWLLHLD
jgi:predicted TIM-barrel fold metal-dependent hydrolase